MNHRMLVAVTGLLWLLPASASAVSMRFEGESVEATRHNLGGADAVERPCGEASGGFALAGLDLEGESVEWKLSLESKLCFRDSLRADGVAGGTWQFRLQVVPSTGGEPIAESLFPETVGHGLDCPIRFEKVGSGESHCLEAGEYRLRLVRVGTGDTRLDWLEIWESPTPVAEISWSRVKALFEER